MESRASLCIRGWLLIFGATLIVQISFAQQEYLLQLETKNITPSFLQEKIIFEKEHADSLSLFNELKNILLRLQEQAYLEVSVDSLSKEGSLFIAYLHLGEQYEWADLKNGNVEPAFLEQIGFRERLFQNRLFNYLEVVEWQEKLLEYAENHGYPFASVWLDGLNIQDNEIGAELFLQKGKLIFFDTLKIEGSVKISKIYLQNYLGLKPGMLYSKKKVLQIRNRLRELPFLKETRASTVTFHDDKAIVNLFVEKKKASRFDFLIGVLPNNDRENQKLLITGTFDAEMENQFGLGEKIFASFERLRPSTQELELSFTYPYILDMPFGVDLSFNQFRRDSTFSTVAFDVGVQYLFEGGNYLKAFWNNTFSNIITVDTNRIKQGRLPEQLDVSNSSFGLEYSWQRLDYRYNPQKGWHFKLRAGAGVKQIQENQAILAVQEGFYDSLKLKTFQYKIDGKIQRYFPFGKRGTILTGIQGGVILSGEPIYQNEQYRIGGNRLLRGFDEESILATLFTVFTMEYRFLIGTNSYFYLFGDYAYLEDRRPEIRRFDRPYGFGTGLTFETSAGVFGISLAVGSQQNNPVNFSNPKIHFGYVNYF